VFNIKSDYHLIFATKKSSFDDSDFFNKIHLTHNIQLAPLFGTLFGQTCRLFIYSLFIVSGSRAVVINLISDAKEHLPSQISEDSILSIQGRPVGGFASSPPPPAPPSSALAQPPLSIASSFSKASFLWYISR